MLHLSFFGHNKDSGGGSTYREKKLLAVSLILRQICVVQIFMDKTLLSSTILGEISIPHQSISLSQHDMNEFMNSYIVNSPARHKVSLFELF